MKGFVPGFALLEVVSQRHTNLLCLIPIQRLQHLRNLAVQQPPFPGIEFVVYILPK